MGGHKGTIRKIGHYIKKAHVAYRKLPHAIRAPLNQAGREIGNSARAMARGTASAYGGPIAGAMVDEKAGRIQRNVERKLTRQSKNLKGQGL